MELQGQGIAITEMLNAMAANQPVYTVPAYSSLDATYAQYPHYVAQLTHTAYLATAAAPQHVVSHSIQDASDRMERYEDSHKRERRELIMIEAGDRDRDRRSRERERDYRDRRDRDRERDRDRRDRDRDHRHRDHRHRDDDRERSPRRDRERDYDRDSLFDEDSRALDYKSMSPNNTIMVRGLAQHIKENDIRADILSCNLIPKDIRLVRKKESGASRGFAFVEFATVHDAARWMDSKQGVLILQDVYRATLQYSIPKDSSDRPLKNTDWFCVRCGAHNFKRRDSCFKCSYARHESEMGDDGMEEICSYPTNTLLIRGLDVLSTEENVLQSIEPDNSDLPIRSVRIGRDPLTNTSRGVCYVELNSVLDSMQLYNKLSDNPLVVDNKQTTFAYCKLHHGSASSSGGSNQNTGSYNHPQPLEYTAGADIKKLAEYSASVYAQTPEEHAAYLEYYTVYYEQQAQAATTSTQSDSVNAAAAVAQSALLAMQQKSGIVPANQHSYSSSSTATQSSEVVEEYPRYPTPDVTSYKYDETSGYYYDEVTGLYYDATSTYYYNSETAQYLYWDAEKSTYLPAPSADDGQGNENRNRDKKEKDKDKQDKVKVAKKIAKDMERWAKAQNKRNETVGKTMTTEQGGPSISGTDGNSGAADAAFAVLLERRERAPVDKQTLQIPVKKENPSALGGLKKSGLVAAYGGDNSESEEEMAHEPEGCEQMLIDVVKMACLLCKRQFPNKDALTKHVKLSSLHRNNLEAYARSAEGQLQQYRDRAKERRDKYGQPNLPPPNKLKERYMAAKEEVQSNQYEEPTRDGIGEDNIGNKLMKKMGWANGMGLGKTNQGRTEIIEAERRIATAGLGMQGSAYSVAGDSYKECVKKMMFHRYQELDAMEKSHK